ncbi:type II secretion system protein GspM [Sphingomicrobium astaxanthinifaciens]|uniref:type II secretion system protein GspM n=1 Tax=Sphingomicrobium astaxanthinifaciens TaxID=1227949 RepID=UPI001FCAA8A9|nr:type II secretion system protein GspM [Sphingomicrobium astaxanthinifaciens]MCJ7421079.1 type II secretion system protein M [Sphingomicrobium astaxanthinifaciens]
MTPLLDWYRARSRREQVMLGAMMLLAVPILGWFLVVAPAMHWHDEARDAYLEASERYGRTVVLAEAVEAGGERAAARRIAQPLSDFVAASAAQAGFALTRNVATGGDRTEVGIAQARPDAALAWLTQLRAAGVAIEGMRLTDNGEGGVEVDLRLAKAAEQ